jgi:predicted metal-binding membrane protein
VAQQGGVRLTGQLFQLNFNLAPVLEFVLKKDYVVVLAALAGMAALTWGLMIQEARGLPGACCQLVAPDARQWDISTVPPLFLMWANMMVAMMIPSAAPMVLTFAMVNRKRGQSDWPLGPTGIFLSGYLSVWVAFSLLVAVLQWMLHAGALLSPRMVSSSPIFGGALLIAAGIFQWTPWKRACLTHCRSPLTFLMTGWRDGKSGAWVMGLQQGAYCTGCCWVLMLLLFVAGVMNLLWIAVITVFVLVEKFVPKGLWLGRMAGAGLIGWGIWMLAWAF